MIRVIKELCACGYENVWGPLGESGDYRVISEPSLQGGTELFQVEKEGKDAREKTGCEKG